MTQTDQQRVPKLRFPGFEGDWESTSVGQAFKIRAGGDIDKSRFSPVQDEEHPFPVFANSKEQRGLYGYASYFVEEGGCVTVSGRGDLGTPNARHERFVPIVRLLVLRPKQSSDIDFLEAAISQLDIFVESTGVPQLTGPQISSYRISLPSLPEQRKIAGFLGAVDTKIAQLAEKKRLLEDYKKGCMQQLFSQKIRFKDDEGNGFPDWEEKPLHTFLTETKAKSDGTEPVFSVSVHKGLIDQVEHLGRSYSAADTGHYNRVEPGDVVYTKSPTGDFPFGIIKQSRLDMPVIVSPLYGVFRPETPWLGYWLHVYFESKIHTGNYLKPIIQKGAKNTINITNTTFLSAKLKVPLHPAEQRKIADFLSALDRKIDLVGQELEHARTFKQGLLQQMFV